MLEYDDLFVLLPSAIAAEQSALNEGKALGTARLQDIALLRQLGDLRKFDPERSSKARKRGRDVAKRQLKALQDVVQTDVGRLISRYRTRTINAKTFATKMRDRMRTAWRDAFMAGLRAGGADGETQAKRSVVKLGPGDDRWLRSAMKHEMRFLNGFIKAVVSGQYTMPLETRMRMYARSLESFYDNGRVIALPATALLYWIGPNDKATCAGCEYMFRNSPYPKLKLPTTPRAGMTPCLSNCRDRLMVRNATMKETLKREQELPSRNAMIARLRKIKRGQE